MPAFKFDPAEAWKGEHFIRGRRDEVDPAELTAAARSEIARLRLAANSGLPVCAASRVTGIPMRRIYELKGKAALSFEDGRRRRPERLRV